VVARYGSDGIADVIALLDDPDANVRTGIAESVGALGSPAVVPLRAVVDGDSERAALAAILGLSRAGREGGETLASIADTHQNASVRAVARLALGKAPGHTH
jgi:HEAT repeat protein